jgi:hypothetical protein
MLRAEVRKVKRSVWTELDPRLRGGDNTSDVQLGI